jgi:hypothetical protein
MLNNRNHFSVQHATSTAVFGITLSWCFPDEQTPLSIRVLDALYVACHPVAMPSCHLGSISKKRGRCSGHQLSMNPAGMSAAFAPKARRLSFHTIEGA